MATLRKFAALGALALASPIAPALAADMPEETVIEAAPVYAASGWYLRGHIGMSSQGVDHLDSPAYDDSITVLQKDFSSASFFGGGIGYKWNDWFRTDLTAEYRGRSAFSGLDWYPDESLGAGFGTNDYSGFKSEWLIMANAYIDLGTWGGFTPYIGGGVGAADIMISDFQDVNVQAGAYGYATDTSTWNFAWAINPGVAFAVTQNVTLDFSYRFLSLGDAATSDMLLPNGGNQVYNPIQFKGLFSHDAMVTMRYAFN